MSQTTYDKVWITVDHVRRLLKAFYSGPYIVLQRTPIVFSD